VPIHPGAGDRAEVRRRRTETSVQISFGSARVLLWPTPWNSGRHWMPARSVRRDWRGTKCSATKATTRLAITPVRLGGCRRRNALAALSAASASRGRRQSSSAAVVPDHHDSQPVQQQFQLLTGVLLEAHVQDLKQRHVGVVQDLHRMPIRHRGGPMRSRGQPTGAAPAGLVAVVI
jgi:hypothetical protein